MIQRQILEIVAISKINGIGPQRLKRLAKLAKSLDSIWSINSDLLAQIIGNQSYAEFLSLGQNFNPQQELEQIEGTNSKLLWFDDKNYPAILKEIPDHPPFLFYRGNLKLLDEPYHKLAIVGSRKFSPYGLETLHRIIPELISAGLIVVSGLALGIDALAHQKTIENQGLTIAILGSSVDFIYPRENSLLADRILTADGLILSEFPPNTPPLKQHFPRRNRLIAGLSRGVLVVEATLKSGSLITANYALDYNRDVFAVPNDIFRENGQGTNQLIKDGAKLVTEANDILLEWQIEKRKASTPIVVREFSPEEHALIRVLSEEPQHIEEVAQEANLSAAQASQLISQLELVGAVKDVGGGYYKKN